MLLHHARLVVWQVPVLIALATPLAHAKAVPQTSEKRAPELVVDGLGKGTVALDGPWQFHLGDNPAWAAPDTEDTGPGWEQLTTDQPWGQQGHYNYTGFAWYRRHVEIAHTASDTLDLALLMQNVDDAYEVYWNGVLVGKFGKLPPNPVLYFDQPNQTYGLGPARSGVLAVRVLMPAPMTSDPGTSGGLETTPELGTSEAIAAGKAMNDYQWLRGRQIGFGICSLSLLIAALSLFAWLRDRNQWMLFWMFGFCLYAPLSLFVLEMRFKVPAEIEYALMQPVYAMGDVSLWFLLLWLLDLWHRPRVMKGTRIAAIVISVVALLDGLDALVGWTSPYTLTMQLADAVLSSITLLLAPVSIVLIGIAIKQQWSGGARLNWVRWLVAIVFFIDEMFTELANASLQGIRFTHWTLAEFVETPLFTINGCSLNPMQLADTLLLLVLVYAVYRNQVENRRRQRHLEQEFQSARELQQVLIPEDLPAIPGYTLTSAYKPALEVGGDFFQIIPLPDQSTLIVVGDVSGKGLKAAMAVSLIVGAIRTLVEISASPAEILASLNRRLYGRLRGGFARAIAMRISSSGHCILSSAGHLAPFLNDRELDLPGALPLGLVPSVSYEETMIQIEELDHIAIFTDGLVEARCSTGELFGFDRLQTLFATGPTAEVATQSAVAFGQDEDITVLTFVRDAGEQATVLSPGPSALAQV